MPQQFSFRPVQLSYRAVPCVVPQDALDAAAAVLRGGPLPATGGGGAAAADDDPVPHVLHAEGELRVRLAALFPEVAPGGGGVSGNCVEGVHGIS